MVLSCLLKESFQITLAIVILAGKVNSKFCHGGHICSPPKECCPLGCCLVYSSSEYRPSDSHISKTSSVYNLFFWNHWLFWLLLAMLLFFCLCACGMWKKKQFFIDRWRDDRSIRNEEDRSELDSTGSCYPPPQYSRCSSFHYAPPPYTEVTSKPDLYPLVISYRSDNGKLGDNRLMVQYFRSYVVHPALGSLSDESTVDSLGSGFFSQSIHEADSTLPPTYEEFRIEGRNMPELEPSTARTPHMQQQNNYFSPEKIIRNTAGEIFQEIRNPTHNEEVQQVVVENIQKSIQLASLATATTARLKTTALNNFNTLQNSAHSLPNNLYTDRTAIKKKLVRPSNLNLGSFQRSNNTITISSCEDSINANNNYVAHQYSSDVILAQPQSYCDSSNELHYHSSDILNRLNYCLRNINNSYSSEDNLSQPRGSLQDFVSSDGLSHSQLSNLEVNNFSTSSDVSSLQGCGTPDSPPQATSPTGELKNLLDKIQLLPVHKDPVRFDQGHESSFEFLSHLRNFQMRESSKVDNVTNDIAEAESESEIIEKSCLLNESAQSVLKTKSKKSLSISQKPFIKGNFPSRSKTFYMPFCHNSLKRNINSKLSTSAPVTPVTNLPSPGSSAFGLATNTNKFGSKRSTQNKGDSIPLLPNEEESHDEVF